MRLAIATLALFTLAATTRDGCGGAGAASGPAYGCEGLSCGDPCGACPPGTPPEHCPVPTFAPTACDARGECVTVGTFACSPEEECEGEGCYDPCDGKACGDACQLCPPDAIGCFETMELKACDATGRCVSRTPDLGCP